MEKLNDYFLYDYTDNGLSDMMDRLSEHLKELHSKNQYVPNLSSNTIMYDGEDFVFTDIEPSSNIELDKRKNLTALAKLFLGCHLSVGNGFKDFSELDDSWIIQNLDDICDTITDEDFNADYFRALFNEGSNEYYTDYLDRMAQNAELGGKGNTNAYKKVLSNAASSIYAEPTYETSEDYEDVTTVEKKTAQVTPIFYPLLIGLSLTAVVGMYVIFKFL